MKFFAYLITISLYLNCLSKDISRHEIGVKQGVSFPNTIQKNSINYTGKHYYPTYYVGLSYRFKYKHNTIFYIEPTFTTILSKITLQGINGSLSPITISTDEKYLSLPVGVEYEFLSLHGVNFFINGNVVFRKEIVTQISSPFKTGYSNNNTERIDLGLGIRLDFPIYKFIYLSIGGNCTSEFYDGFEKPLPVNKMYALYFITNYFIINFKI